jgi:beta-carotene/zeaxanthin 4-ketolase
VHSKTLKMRINLEFFKDIKGVLIALSIIALWSCLSIFGLSFNIQASSFFIVSVTVLLLTFLYTGLFITAHDAMHNSLYPKNIKINNFIGHTCVILYAAFDYKKLLQEHRKHHLKPATNEDPDFCINNNFFVWYFRFMQNYLSLKQIVIMFLVAQTLQHFFKVPLANIILFWALPAVLSTLQLFYFGTYLPHKKPKNGYTNIHKATNSNYSEFVSFLTCYHFGGYHYEHHHKPSVPWWQLPGLKQVCFNKKNIY